MDENLESVLEESIQALRGGDTIAACLARYPEYAEVLAPLLRSAQELDAATVWELPRGSWARHRPQIYTAMAELQARRPWWVPLFEAATSRPARAIAAGAANLLIFVLLAVASQPGDLPYRWNLLYEQVPIWLEDDHVARRIAELEYADQRCADLHAAFTATGAVDLAALQALLDADEVAAQDSAGRGREVEEHTAASIEAHARCLFEFSVSAGEGGASEMLRRAANQLLEYAALASSQANAE